MSATRPPRVNFACVFRGGYLPPLFCRCILFDTLLYEPKHLYVVHMLFRYPDEIPTFSRLSPVMAPISSPRADLRGGEPIRRPFCDVKSTLVQSTTLCFVAMKTNSQMTDSVGDYEYARISRKYGYFQRPRNPLDVAS
jgi:hypothetical protein